MFLLVFQASVCDDWLCSQCFYLCSRQVFEKTGCVLNVSTCVPGKCLRRLAVFAMFLLVFKGSVCEDWLCSQCFSLCSMEVCCEDWLCSQCFSLCSREVFVKTGCVLNVSPCVQGKCL